VGNHCVKDMPISHFSITKSAVQKRRSIALNVRKAERLLSIQDASTAISILESLLEEDANHVPALEIAARAYWQLQDLVKVVDLTDQLIRINPFEPGYHGLRGLALRALGRYGEAARALSRDPLATEALHELEGFQAELVRNLLEADPAFAVQYAKDPMIALADRGFYFKRREAAVAWVAENVQQSLSYTRPS